MATANTGEGGSVRPWLRRSLSVNDAVPLKTRMYSAWYRFRYGWQFQSSIHLDNSPVWLLGKCYHSVDPIEEDDELEKEGAPPHIIQMLEHYYSLPWMTYRTNFAPITNTLLTTDCGWGCMVRSGQMLLATALHYFLLGRDWRLRSTSDRDKTTHTQILSWFADSPQKLCPFSLHSLMKQAELQGYSPGDWYGPSQISSIIARCVDRAKNEHPILEKLIVYLARDCTVYVKDVKQLFQFNEGGSLFLLVPIRLGGEALNPIYIPCVQTLLTLDHCIGIIGGRPRHSVYFVGFQDDKLLNLDPHYCQAAVSVTGSEFDIRTYHCSTPRKLTANKMDPSCAIGFFCRDLEDFFSLRKETEPVLAPPKQKGVYPFFTFNDLALADVIDEANFRQLDVSTAPSGGGESRSSRATDSHSFNYSDEDFLVVDCRNNSPDTTCSTPPSGLHKSGSGQSASQTAKTENNVSNGITDSASGT